jgi:hypothetical protein
VHIKSQIYSNYTLQIYRQLKQQKKHGAQVCNSFLPPTTSDSVAQKEVSEMLLSVICDKLQNASVKKTRKMSGKFPSINSGKF